MALVSVRTLPYYLQRICAFIESRSKTITFPDISLELKDVLIIITEKPDHLNGDQFSDNFDVKFEAARLIAVMKAHAHIKLKHEFPEHIPNALMYRKVETPLKPLEETPVKPLEPLRKPTYLVMSKFEPPSPIVTPIFKTQCLNTVTDFIKDESSLIMAFPEMSTNQVEFAMKMVLTGIEGQTGQVDIGFGYRSMYASLWELMRSAQMKYKFSIGYLEPANNKSKVKLIAIQKTPRRRLRDKLEVFLDESKKKLEKSSTPLSTSAVDSNPTAVPLVSSSKSTSTVEEDLKPVPEDSKMVPPKDMKLPENSKASPPSSNEDSKISPPNNLRVPPNNPKIVRPPKDEMIPPPIDFKLPPPQYQNQVQTDLSRNMQCRISKLRYKIEQRLISPEFIQSSLQRLSSFILNEEESSIVFEKITPHQYNFLDNIAWTSKEDLTYMFFSSECQRYLGDIKFGLSNGVQYKTKFSGPPKNKDVRFDKKAALCYKHKVNLKKRLLESSYEQRNKRLLELSDKLVNGVNKGLNSSNKPVNEGNKGLESSNKPVNEVNKSLVSSGKPVKEENKGLESSGKPVNDVNKALESSGKPVNEGNKGLESSGKPVNDVNKALESSGKPVNEGNKGLESSKKPVNEGNKGLESSKKTVNKLLVSSGKPVKEENKGLESSGKPVNDVNKALESSGKPVNEGNKGLESSKKPVNEGNKGLESSGKPVNEGNKGLESSNKPVNEVNKLLVSSGKPVNKGNKGLESSNKLVNEVNKLLVSSGKPVKEGNKGLESSKKPVNEVNRGLESSGKPVNEGNKEIESSNKLINVEHEASKTPVNNKENKGSNTNKVPKGLTQEQQDCIARCKAIKDQVEKNSGEGYIEDSLADISDFLSDVNTDRALIFQATKDQAAFLAYVYRLSKTEVVYYLFSKKCQNLLCSIKKNAGNYRMRFESKDGENEGYATIKIIKTPLDEEKSSTPLSPSAVTSNTSAVPLVSRKSTSTVKEDLKPVPDSKMVPPKDMKLPENTKTSPPSSTEDSKISPPNNLKVPPNNPKIVRPPKDEKIPPPIDFKTPPTQYQNQVQTDQPSRNMLFRISKLRYKIEQRLISPEFIQSSLQRLSSFVLNEEAASIVFEKMTPHQYNFLDNIAWTSKEDLTYMFFTSECQRYLGDIKFGLSNGVQYKTKFSGPPKNKDVRFDKTAALCYKHKGNKGLESSNKPVNEGNKGLESSNKPVNEVNKLLVSSGKPGKEGNKGLESSKKPVNEGNKKIESSNKLINVEHEASKTLVNNKENKGSNTNKVPKGLTQEQQDCIARCKAIKDQVEKNSGEGYIEDSLADISDFLSDVNTDRALIFQATKDQAAFLAYVYRLSKTEVVYYLFSKKCQNLLCSIKKNAGNYRMRFESKVDENEGYATIKIIKTPLDEEKATIPVKSRRKKIKGNAETRSNCGDSAAKRRSKIMEGLSQPVQCEKAMKMMQSMGWKGGALGLRGDGITEPIMPTMDSLIAKRTGLGAELPSPKPKPPRGKRQHKGAAGSPAGDDAASSTASPPPRRWSMQGRLLPLEISNRGQVEGEKTILLYRDYNTVVLESMLQLVTSDIESMRLVYMLRNKHKKVRSFIKQAVSCFNKRTTLTVAVEHQITAIAEISAVMAAQPDLVIHFQDLEVGHFLLQTYTKQPSENNSPTKNRKVQVAAQEDNRETLSATPINDRILKRALANAAAKAAKNIPIATDNKDENETATYLMIANDELINLPDQTGGIPTQITENETQNKSYETDNKIDDKMATNRMINNNELTNLPDHTGGIADQITENFTNNKSYETDNKIDNDTASNLMFVNDKLTNLPDHTNLSDHTGGIPNQIRENETHNKSHETDNKIGNETATNVMITNDELTNVPGRTNSDQIIENTTKQSDGINADTSEITIMNLKIKSIIINDPIISQKREDDCQIILNDSDSNAIDAEGKDLGVKTEKNKAKDKVATDNAQKSKSEIMPGPEDAIDALVIDTNKETIKLDKDNSAYNQDNNNLRKRLSVDTLNDYDKDSNVKKFKSTTELKKINILPKDYPKSKMDRDKAREIQTAILKAIDNTKGKLPLLYCQGIQNGGLIYNCLNEKSVFIIQDIVKSIDNLTIVYEFEENVASHKMSFKLNSFVDEDASIIFNRLKLYNSGLDVKKWEFLRKEQRDDYIVIYVGLDEKSFDYVREANFVLNAGNDCAKFTILWD